MMSKKLNNSGYCLFSSSIGTCGIAWSGTLITFLQLPESTEASTRKKISKRSQAQFVKSPPSAIKNIIAKIQLHLSGQMQDLTRATVDFNKSTAFQCLVYKTVAKIPSGEVLTYQQVAKLIGRPQSARAVGNALGKNPVPLLTPCHRVVGKSKNSGGFTAYGGLSLKEKILKIEGADC